MSIEAFIVDTPQGLLDLYGYEKSIPGDMFVLDVETDGINEKTALLYGIGVCFEESEGFYIPIRHGDGSKVFDNSDTAKLGTWLQEMSHKRKLIGHNIIYDVLVLENNMGIDLAPLIYSDTILQKHILDEERPFGLKEVAVRYLGSWADKAQQALYENIKKNGGSTTKDNLEMFKADTEVLGEYCVWDVVLTLKLFNIFEPRIEAEGLKAFFYEDECMPLYRECTIPMKRRGFDIDKPFFERLKSDLEKDIQTLEDNIYAAIQPELHMWEQTYLYKEYPISRAGSFPKILGLSLGVVLPTNKKGNITLAKAAVDKMEGHPFYAWLKGDDSALSGSQLLRAQRSWWSESHPDDKHMFNIGSGAQLAWLLFEHLGETPLSYTEETKKPQVDEDMLESIKDRHDWIQPLIDYKKLNKLLSTYVIGILDLETNGVIHTSLKQFGTTSGRYASSSPNLQNLPSVKSDEDSGLSPLVVSYVNKIRQGFVAPKGGYLVGSDFSQLEAVCFASVSGDTNLQKVFLNGDDLYSAVAINTFGLTQYSANKKDKNFLKHHAPDKRKLSKVFTLASVYGAEAFRIAESLGVSYQEAQSILDAYFEAYPGLVKYMKKCDDSAMYKGYVSGPLGRVRHLPKAKVLCQRYGARLLNRKWAKEQGLHEARRTLKGLLNAAKNQPIQGLAASITNRAMIAIARALKHKGLKAELVLQIHDEVVLAGVDPEEATKVCAIVKHAMETTTRIAVPLVAEPVVGKHLAATK